LVIIQLDIPLNFLKFSMEVRSRKSSSEGDDALTAFLEV